MHLHFWLFPLFLTPYEPLWPLLSVFAYLKSFLLLHFMHANDLCVLLLKGLLALSCPYLEVNRILHLEFCNLANNGPECQNTMVASWEEELFTIWCNRGNKKNWNIFIKWTTQLVVDDSSTVILVLALCAKVRKSCLVQIFGLRTTGCSLWWKLITLPLKFFFFFPSMNDWASVMSCQHWLGLPARQKLMSWVIWSGGYRTHRAHFVTSTRAFLCGHRLRWKRATPTGRTKLLSRSGESLDVRRGRNVAFLCNCSQSHGHTRTCYALSHVHSQSSAHHLLLLQGAIFELRRCLSLWRNPLVLSPNPS